MKKLIMTAALAFACLPAWAFSTADLAQMLQKSGNVQGAFVQERHVKSLAKPIAAQGRFVLVPRQGLLWHMHKPFDSRLRVRADGIMQLQNGVWVAGAQNKSVQNRQIGLFLDLLGGNTQSLEKQFDIRLEGEAQQWQLRLTPKTALMKQIFNHIAISGDAVVRRIELAEKQGDRTVMRFSQVETGKGLDAQTRQHLLGR